MASKTKVRKLVPKGCIYQRGEIWWYAGPNPGGGPRHVSLGVRLKSEAVTLANSEYERRTAGQPHTSIDKLLGEFIEELRTKGRAAAYVKDIDRNLRAFFKSQKIGECSQFTPEAAERWWDELGEHPKTIKNKRGHMSVFGAFLVRKRKLHANPIDITEPPEDAGSPIDHLTREELGSVVDAATSLKLDPVLVAAYAGLRCGELGRIERNDVRLGESPSLLVRATPQKGGLSSVPVHPKLVPILQRLLANPEHPTLLFAPRSRSAWYELLAPIQAVVPRVRGYHIFRHTIASLLLQEGQRIEDVSRILRHGEIRTTENYYAQFTVEHGGRQALGKL
jgi:integrase